MTCLNASFIMISQSLPEYEQWSQDLMMTWDNAKNLLKKGPKLISVKSGAEEAQINKVNFFSKHTNLLLFIGVYKCRKYCNTF